MSILVAKVGSIFANNPYVNDQPTHFQMPPRVPKLERALTALQNSYTCPSCHFYALYPSQWASKAATRPIKRPLYASKPSLLRLSRRNASALSPVTAVNAKKNIPRNVEKLYQRLGALEHDAGLYVNVSQLRLALRGLESRDAVTRIASML